MWRVCFLVLGLVASGALAEERTVVVRERASASFAEGALTFQVLKIRGYSIDILIGGERRVVKLGGVLTPPSGACAVRFEKISPETRIARFRTDCP